MPGTVPARTRRKKDKQPIHVKQDNRVENFENSPKEAAFEDVSLLDDAEMQDQTAREIQDVEADEMAGKKKVKKRVKLRLN